MSTTSNLHFDEHNRPTLITEAWVGAWPEVVKVVARQNGYPSHELTVFLDSLSVDEADEFVKSTRRAMKAVVKWNDGRREA